MAAILLRPQVVSFLDVVTGDGELALRLEQIPVPVGSPLAGVTLAEARIRNRTGRIVLGRSEQIDSLLEIVRG
jgi:voltage-gated potassium channel